MPLAASLKHVSATVTFKAPESSIAAVARFRGARSRDVVRAQAASSNQAVTAQISESELKRCPASRDDC
jgi:hypothetical protein